MRLPATLAIFILLFNASYCLAQDETGIRELERGFLRYQLQKGRFSVGTDFALGLGYRSNNLLIGSSTVLVDINFSGRVGYMLFERLMVGMKGNLFQSVTTFDFQNQYRLRSQTMGGLVRYYTSYGLFAETFGGPAIGTENRTRNGMDNSRSFSGLHLSGGAGFANFWAPRFNFEIALRYNWMQGSFDQFADQLQFRGITLNAGIGYVF
jgi:hypothetical protein